MALNFDDRVLGGKVENYVGSSDEGSGDEAANNPAVGQVLAAEMMAASRSVRTGPKGVLEDYQDFRRKEKEQRIEQHAMYSAKLKATAMTVKTDREEEEQRRIEEELEKLNEKSKSDSDDDEFLKEYRIRRMREMYKAQQASMSHFGALLTLNADNFVTEIDNETPQTLVIVHVYEPDIPACDAMNGCLIVLAAEHTSVKFCRVRASSVKMSQKFLNRGLPSLLVYQNKQLISTFVSMSRFLGKDFFAKDVEGFLQEHGLLCEKEPGKLLDSPRPDNIKQTRRRQSSDDDDDDDDE